MPAQSHPLQLHHAYEKHPRRVYVDINGLTQNYCTIASERVEIGVPLDTGQFSDGHFQTIDSTGTDSQTQNDREKKKDAKQHSIKLCTRRA